MENNFFKLRSWISYDDSTDFPIQNIPFGICRHSEFGIFAATRIGNSVINLSQLRQNNFIAEIPHWVLIENSLNSLIGLGKKITNQLREDLIKIFTDVSCPINQNADLRNLICIPVDEVMMLMPVNIGDYTDFYSSIDHATNVGKIFRDPENALLPNWKHMPVGYHGRASSIRISGESFYRPRGQSKGDQDELPTFGPSRLLDFELEVGFIIGKENGLGNPVSTSEAESYIFGLVLFNDWSARDIQKWEYVPLGPFQGKNFFSSISPWIITLEALEPFRMEGPNQIPEVLPYLKYQGNKHYDIDLEVYIQPENGTENLISKSNFKFMYWNMAQQLAHHTINGCNLKTGDLMASGTISGPNSNSFGSMLELTWKGTKPLKLSDGTERKFIADQDTVIFKGSGTKDGVHIGFGEVKNKVLPSK